MMNNEFKYVFQFRGPIRSELCNILDLNDKWRELAALLGYSVRDAEQIVKIAGSKSPSDVLLEQWGQKAPTIHKLFITLSEMQHYQALMLMKDFVPEEFHTLINEGEENLDTLDNEDEAETDSECFSSSDTNYIVAQNDSASKHLNSKLIDIKRAISSTTNMKAISQQFAAHTSYNEICNTGHHSPRLLAFPPNVKVHEAHMKDVFHRITEQEDGASAATVNLSSAHTGLAISAPPACFVPPEVLNAPALNSPAFNGNGPVSLWINSESSCNGILPHDECTRINPSLSNPNVVEKNNTLHESTFSSPGLPSSMIDTSQNASRPARRVLGSSLTSKKLMLGAL